MRDSQLVCYFHSPLVYQVQKLGAHFQRIVNGDIIPSVGISHAAAPKVRQFLRSVVFLLKPWLQGDDDTPGISFRIAQELSEVAFKIGQHLLEIAHGIADFPGMGPHQPGSPQPSARILSDMNRFQPADHGFPAHQVQGRATGTPGKTPARTDKAGVRNRHGGRPVCGRGTDLEPAPDVIASGHDDDGIQRPVLRQDLLEGDIHMGGRHSGPRDIAHVDGRRPERFYVFRPVEDVLQPSGPTCRLVQKGAFRLTSPGHQNAVTVCPGARRLMTPFSVPVDLKANPPFKLRKEDRVGMVLQPDVRGPDIVPLLPPKPPSAPKLQTRAERQQHHDDCDDP